MEIPEVVRWTPAVLAGLYVSWMSWGVLKRRGQVPRSFATSRWTTYFLFFLLFGNIGFSILERAVRGGHPPVFLSWAGILLVGIKAVMTVWSVRTLGPWYSYHLTRKEGQELVLEGPYAICRHPLYAARFFASAGIPLAFGAFFVLPAILLMDSLAIYFRIREEESVLMHAFGKNYERYRSSVGALLPFKALLSNTKG